MPKYKLKQSIAFSLCSPIFGFNNLFQKNFFKKIDAIVGTYRQQACHFYNYLIKFGKSKVRDFLAGFL